MDALRPLLFFIFVPLFLAYTASCVDVCEPSSCGRGKPVVRFPFRLKDRQPERCGFPDFDLSCNNQSHTVLNLPSSGEFVVSTIDYESQTIRIDPDLCGSNRIINFSLSGSPFVGVRVRNYTFFNCSSNYLPGKMLDAMPINCLSTSNYRIFALVSPTRHEEFEIRCRNISTISVPVHRHRAYQSRSAMDLRMNMSLVWSKPSCRFCEGRGGTCRFKSGTGLEVGCFNLPGKAGIPRSAKYGIILGVGIPGLVCIIGLLCFISGKIRDYRHRGRTNTDFWTHSINPQSTVATGLDGVIIESYPKIVLGDSKRLPEPNEKICPICLSEYQPKETLRSLPECTHYFHASCIDEWLRLNASCPLCRNSPESSSMVTPCSSVSSTTVLLTSTAPTASS